ncbi:MAG: TldD/PmbA family protein [Egibacteraceae bacterium]
MSLLELLGRVVARARLGEAVEVYGLDETTMTVKAYEGEVESLSSARTRGVGVRVIGGGRVGYSSTADLSETALAETLDEARANARVGTPDEANVLPQAAQALGELPELWDPAFHEFATEDKIAAVITLEAAVRGAGSPVKGVDSAVYGDQVRTAAIASTAGVCGAYRRCDAYVAVNALAEGNGAGEGASAYGFDLARTVGGLDPEAAAAEAVGRATRLLGGRKPPSTKPLVLLDPYATTSLLEVLSGALTGQAVQRGRSAFATRLGEQVAGPHVALVDDGRLVAGPAAAPWDGEGVPTGRTTLIEAGHLAGWLHNTYTATKQGVASTGNARRAGFVSLPGVSPSNLYFVPGDEDQAALLARADTAFYCQQVIGIHSGANPISGDFSVGVSGLMVRGGEFAEPIREAALAGTFPGMLSGLVAVGSDLRFIPFGWGLGGVTLLIEGMTLAGE